MKTKIKKAKIVTVSGGFDPVHIGHIRLFKAARELGDKLIVILNNEKYKLTSVSTKYFHFFAPFGFSLLDFLLLEFIPSLKVKLRLTIICNILKNII